MSGSNIPDQNGDDKAPLVDADLPRTLAGARRVRFFTRLSALALIAVCVYIGEADWPDWVIGALLGGLVVEVNLSLLLRFLARASDWKGRSIWPTLLFFYLSFGASILICVLVVRNHWGHPLAFLLGLFSFIVGLALGLVSLAVKK